VRNTITPPDTADALFENLRLELRRGCLVLAVLGHLRREHYGYTLKRALAERGLAVDEGTLYPLLRRLESQGLLVSEWREEDKRQKRFYRLSDAGAQIAGQLAAEWRSLNTALDRILEAPRS
jgi:PadR family transcriptional regulator PadR